MRDPDAELVEKIIQTMQKEWHEGIDDGSALDLARLVIPMVREADKAALKGQRLGCAEPVLITRIAFPQSNYRADPVDPPVDAPLPEPPKGGGHYMQGGHYIAPPEPPASAEPDAELVEKVRSYALSWRLVELDPHGTCFTRRVIALVRKADEARAHPIMKNVRCPHCDAGQMLTSGRRSETCYACDRPLWTPDKGWTDFEAAPPPALDLWRVENYGGSFVGTGKIIDSAGKTIATFIERGYADAIVTAHNASQGGGR